MKTAKNSNQVENLSSEHTNTTKKKYISPKIESEVLNTYGAVCNGTANGGRKASTAAPDLCNSKRLNS